LSSCLQENQSKTTWRKVHDCLSKRKLLLCGHCEDVQRQEVRYLRFVAMYACTGCLDAFSVTTAWLMSGRAEEVTLKSTLWFCLLWLNVGWRIPLRYTVLVAKVSRTMAYSRPAKRRKLEGPSCSSLICRGRIKSYFISLCSSSEEILERQLIIQSRNIFCNWESSRGPCVVQTWFPG